MNAKTPLSRRIFLRALGVSAAAFPFVGGLASLARGQEQDARRRFITVYTPNGMLYDRWRPTGVTAASPGQPYAATSLTAPSFEWSPILSPLAKVADKLLILDRLTIGAARHNGLPGYPATGTIGHQRGMAALLTGLPIDPSTGDSVDSVPNPGLAASSTLDQVLAKKNAGQTSHNSLQLGWRVDKNYADRHVNKALSYSGANSPIYPKDDPFEVYSVVFGNGGSDTTGPDPEVVARLARRKSVMDSVLDDFSRLTPRLSGKDRELLEFHADSMRDIETRLTTLAEIGAECSPTKPSDVLGETPALSDNELAPLIADLMMDLTAQAILCDQTRIITFMFANSETDQSYPWLNVNTGHHTMSHEYAADLIKVDNWYAGRVLRLLQALDSVQEGDGSVLDNSAVWWCSCLSDASAHDQINMPFVLAGGLGGAFKTGRYLYFTRPELDESDDPWKPRVGHRDSDPSNNDLLVSIANGMGHEIETFGLPQVCHGPLPGLAG